MAVSRASINLPRHQQGLVLLVLVIIIMLAASSYTLSELSISRVKADRDKQTLINLKKAKQALINYAVTYSDRGVDNDYGILPYPETILLNSNDGNTATVVTGSLKNTNVVGWLPWRALGLSNLKDDSGTCLFYAVSGTYKLGASVQADMVNDDSIGMFRVYNNAGTIVKGGSADKQIVAIVFAPGDALPGQVRVPTVTTSSCGRDYGNVSAYLEGDGAYDNSTLSSAIDEIDEFIHSTEASSEEATPYNDKFLTITREEIWDAIVKRKDFKQDMETLTLALTTCLVNYANMGSNTYRRLPWPVNTSFAAIETDYRDNNKYQDESLASVLMNGYSGRFPFKVANSNAAINGAITENNIFDIAGLCDEAGLALGLDAEGVAVSLVSSPETKYRKLWNNWKDHFFYTLSKRYQSNSSASAEASCLLTGGAAGDCVSVALSPTPTITTEYAATVIFSGSRLPGVTRNDKTDVAEYLEDGKGTIFANEKMSITGDGLYIYTDPQTDEVNDIMYCISDQAAGTPLDVIECI